MNKFDYLKNAIDTLRNMERGNSPAELCYEFDRFIREQIFGKFKIELTADDVVDLQDYYIQTLEV